MLNTAAPRSAEHAARNAPKQDLRAWLAQMRDAGELVTVTGADRDEEIGGIVDIYQRTMGAPAVMFQDIPGFPPRHRVESRWSCRSTAGSSKRSSMSSTTR